MQFTNLMDCYHENVCYIITYIFGEYKVDKLKISMYGVNCTSIIIKIINYQDI